MAGKSQIEWTEHTWNPIVGCSIVSPGCTNCYAMRMARRIDLMSIVSPLAGKSYGGLTKVVNGNPVWTGALRFVERALTVPLKRKKPTTYFVNSMGDLFHEDTPDEWIDKVFAVMALCPQHTFQVLTKRAEQMRAYFDERFAAHRYTALGTRWALAASELVDDDIGPFPGFPLPNVWLGVSCERQQEADERIPLLLQTPAAVRFISAEPLLGPINIRGWGRHDSDRSFALLDWVIVGGESGPNARPMHPDWARSLRDQCEAAGVPMFFKQWGQFVPLEEPFEGRRHGIGVNYYNPSMKSVGKKKAGRLLDGREHNAMPLSDHQNAPTDDATGQRSGLSP